MSTYVLIPGACHGAWCYDDLADALRALGHRVLAYTLTGVAERAHLAHRGVNLTTHIDDVLAALTVDTDGEPVILVGHSYGGMVISGVADRLDGRVQGLVYLDAFVPRDGESCWTLTNDEQREWYADLDDSGFGIPPLPFFDPRASAHPLAAMMQRIALRSDLSHVPRRIYVFAERWPTESPFAPTLARVRDDPSWEVHSLDGAHNLMRDCPDQLVQIIGGTV